MPGDHTGTDGITIIIDIVVDHVKDALPDERQSISMGLGVLCMQKHAKRKHFQQISNAFAGCRQPLQSLKRAKSEAVLSVGRMLCMFARILVEWRYGQIFYPGRGTTLE